MDGVPKMLVSILENMKYSFSDLRMPPSHLKLCLLTFHTSLLSIQILTINLARCLLAYQDSRSFSLAYLSSSDGATTTGKGNTAAGIRITAFLFGVLK